MGFSRSDTWNYAFINVIEQMTDGSVWDPSILGIDPEEISTNHLTNGYGVTHWSVKASIQGSGNAPAFEKNMGGRKNWGVGQKLKNIEDHIQL